MTLKQGVPQKKYKQRTKKLGQKPIHAGDTLPKEIKTLSDGSGRTPTDIFPDWRKNGATYKEAFFAAEYLINGFNQTEAARAVSEPGLLDASYTSMGSSFMRSPKVQELLDDYTTAWLRGKAFELEKNVIETLQAQAFYDVSMFLNSDGTPRFSSWDEVPVPFRRCIEGMSRKFYGSNAQRETLDITFTKRDTALKALATYISIIKNGPTAANDQKNSVKVSAEAELVLSAVLNGGRKVDRRTPAQIREDNAKAKAEMKEVAQEAAETAVKTITFSGLG